MRFFSTLGRILTDGADKERYKPVLRVKHMCATTIGVTLGINRHLTGVDLMHNEMRAWGKDLEARMH